MPREPDPVLPAPAREPEHGADAGLVLGLALLGAGALFVLAMLLLV